MCLHASRYVFTCVCERDLVYIHLNKHESDFHMCVCVWVHACMHVCVRKGEIIYTHAYKDVHMHTHTHESHVRDSSPHNVCVCVCIWWRERDIERERERKRERECLTSMTQGPPFEDPGSNVSEISSLPPFHPSIDMHIYVCIRLKNLPFPSLHSTYIYVVFMRFRNRLSPAIPPHT